MKHVIETRCPHPVKAHYRWLDEYKLAATEAEFLAMEQQGIVRCSNSSWASPLHMVRKKDGTVVFTQQKESSKSVYYVFRD